MPSVKMLAWNPEKSDRLLRERGRSFADIAAAIENGGVLDVLAHASRLEQRVFIVKIDAYAWVVPFVESDSEFFLKTAWPSRKYTKEYLGGPS